MTIDAIREDLILFTNADFSHIIPAEDINGDPINFSGWSGASQLRTAAGGTLLVTFTVTLTTGYVEISAPLASVSALSEQTGYYDIVLTDSLGEKTNIRYGAIDVIKGVTV